MHSSDDFRPLPVGTNHEGDTRSVGIELEFTGLTLDQAADAVLNNFDAKIKAETQAEKVIEIAALGEFVIEVDWAFLKQQAQDFKEQGREDKWLGYLGEMATKLVPLEIVSSPMKWHDLHRLEQLTTLLMRCGAKGTEHSLLSAYGLHINIDVSSLEADVLHAYLKAFGLLQWWLSDYHEVDISRKVTPYIDFFSHEYIHGLCEKTASSTDELIDDYLRFNNSRNRALDMMPVLKYLDAERLEAAAKDDRIKARPAFHYRLPNCKINRPDWGLRRAWNGWWHVENLANNPDLLDDLGQQYLQLSKPLIGVGKKQWLSLLDECLENQESA